MGYGITRRWIDLVTPQINEYLNILDRRCYSDKSMNKQLIPSEVFEKKKKFINDQCNKE